MKIENNVAQIISDEEVKRRKEFIKLRKAILAEIDSKIAALYLLYPEFKPE